MNVNEWVHESIECSGAGPEPFTDAQFESVAHLVAAASRALGLPINRSTVVVHADINGVSRRSDPWPPATRETRVKREDHRWLAAPDGARLGVRDVSRHFTVSRPRGQCRIPLERISRLKSDYLPTPFPSDTVLACPSHSSPSSLSERSTSTAC